MRCFLFLTMPFFIFSQSYQDTISEKKYPFKVFDSSYEGYLEKGQKVNGLKNGEILLLDIGTGNVKAKVNYINGKISGAFTTYHKNSKPELQGNIKDGDYHGLWKSYHSNGNLESEGHYKNRSKKIGNWKYYHANGNLESEGLIIYKKKQGFGTSFGLDNISWCVMDKTDQTEISWLVKK